MKRKQSFITGAIILGISGITARFLGLFFRWPVTMLIGDEGIGLYQLAYPVYMFIISIMSGFPIAISRMVSERVATGRRDDAFKVFKASLLVLAVVGITCSILLYISTPFLIKVLRWRADAYYSIIAVAFAPAFVSIMDAYRGYFQGLQMMSIPAASQIVEQFGRVIAGVGLTYMLMPYGVSLSAAGASFGACAGAVLGCILLICGYMKYKRCIILMRTEGIGEKRSKIISELLSIAIPISFGMTVASIMSLIDSIVVPARLLTAGFGEKIATELYGQLTGKAHVLVNVPLAFSVALGTSLVPAMSEVKALRNVNKIKKRAENALRVSMLLGFPSAAGLFILADPALNLIFPGRSGGSDVLQILSISIVFIVMAQTLVSILQGVGDVMSPVKNLAAGSFVKFILAYILTGMPLLNVKGAAISSIAGYAIAAILNLKDAIKCTYLIFDIDKMVLRPLLSTLIMGIAVYITYNKILNLSGTNGISTIFSVIVGIIVYIIMLLLTGSLSLGDTVKLLRQKKQRR